MEPAAIFLLLIVLAFIVFFVARPFFQQRQVRSEENNRELSSLLAERERLLTALQELDFDQSLGKIPAEDYPVQRAILLQKGAEVLRHLDALAPTSARQDGNVQVPRGTSKSTAAYTEDDLEDLLAKRRNSRKEKTAGFCPKCGKPILLTDAFCPSCGNILKSL
jgi:hypothetical protein